MPRRKTVQLPAELLVAIFEDGRPPLQDGIELWRCFYLDLCRFALVHRTWTTWAQELLFTHIWPNGGSRSLSTSSALDSLPRAPRHLRQKTRSMSLQLGRSLHPTGPRSATLVIAQHGSWDQFAEILRAFPSVHTLQLNLHALDILQMGMDEDQLAVVRQYTSLRRLTLCAYVASEQDALNQLVVSWPRLERLELDGPLERLFFAFVPAPESAPALVHLRELVFRLEVGEDAQEWLRTTFAGASQLRALRCSAADLPTFLGLLHGTLEDLTVDFTDGAVLEHGALAGLAQCGALHRLMLTDDTLATSALQSFPTTLRHVSLLVDPQLLLRTNLNWSTLKAITVAWPLGMRDPNADEGTAQKGYNNLQEKCSKHGVEFTLLEEVPDSWTT